MSTADKLLKFLNSDNIAKDIEEDQLNKIAESVIKGYKIDDESRKSWLDTNKEAMRIIKHCESDPEQKRDFPFEGSAQVIYPLLAPAVIQLASRLIPHLVRNDRVVECKVLGSDTNPEIDMKTGQPTGKNVKAAKAERVSNFLNYEFLIDSDTWLKDMHKACHIVSSWGTAFAQVTYDPVFKRNTFELIEPEHVIINHNISSLEKAPRITIRHYLTKNDLIQNIRSGFFLDVDLDTLDTQPNDSEQSNSEDDHPVHEFLCQTCYLDLDDDGYEEPYKVYVHNKSKKVLCIYPAYELNDIDIDEEGKVLSIKRRLDIVDFHAIDSPDGKFYSIGLNYLLLHPNKSITSIQRQLIDAGTLHNASAVSGFMTKAFKTRERSLRIKMGEFQVLDCNPSIDPQKHIFNLPFKEPSQVLLGLLTMIVQSSEKNGFITDVLTGDTQGQNVPATTMLAMVEQGTRAFKPMVQKLHNSLKKLFKMWFHLHSKYMEKDPSGTYYNKVMMVQPGDFDESVMDIVPVADPTQSSEAHKYAKLQAMMQAMQTIPGAHNLPAALMLYYKEIGFENPEQIVAQPSPPPPDPKMMEVQLKGQVAEMQNKIDQMDIALKAEKLNTEKMKVAIKAQELSIKKSQSEAAKMKMIGDAKKDLAEASIKHKMANVAAKKVEVEEKKVEVMKQKGNSE